MSEPTNADASVKIPNPFKNKYFTRIRIQIFQYKCLTPTENLERIRRYVHLIARDINSQLKTILTLAMGRQNIGVSYLNRTFTEGG